jgi:hypothetical protein
METKVRTLSELLAEKITLGKDTCYGFYCAYAHVAKYNYFTQFMLDIKDGKAITKPNYTYILSDNLVGAQIDVCVDCKCVIDESMEVCNYSILEGVCKNSTIVWCDGLIQCIVNYRKPLLNVADFEFINKLKSQFEKKYLKL